MLFIETPIFTRQIKELVDDDHYRQLQLRLVVVSMRVVHPS
jgi:hypothetical protein